MIYYRYRTYAGTAKKKKKELTDDDGLDLGDLGLEEEPSDRGSSAPSGRGKEGLKPPIVPEKKLNVPERVKQAAVSVDDTGETAPEDDGFAGFTYDPPPMPLESTIDAGEDAREDQHEKAFSDT